MTKSDFEKTFNTYFAHLDCHESKTDQKKTLVSFLNVSVEPSPFCEVVDEELYHFSNNLLKKYADCLNKESKELKERKIEEKNKDQNKNNFAKSLESTLPIKKKVEKIYDVNASFTQQSNQILTFLNLPKIEYNFMKENSLFSCFTTVDGVEFESEMFYEKDLAKEDMCKKIVHYLDEKYEIQLKKPRSEETN